ncbi:MAG: 2-hydroxyhepta-2,4-diene-1,7-dioate isomerase [Chloroflexi bacterium HGW-Chloroflexi-4]|jgi:2-keto-4-pentenoate hydratase/2-oxohepta-3-ene-1,7-dioic acid hydratase in catechol pathway|nr:MAG: 2-hydroxyhepta-2,4-diene-1,7-dioate isomerase [Chloroflexi bacterium HGW-Chloroflexi-4]
MKFARFITREKTIRMGWINEDQIGVVEGDIFGEYRRLEATLSLNNVTLLPPVEPGKIICLGRNYVEHAKEQGAEVPESPLIFLKAQTAILPDRGEIVLPVQSEQVEHEAELVVVIGKKGRWIPVEQSLNHVFGFTIGNDVTARDLQHKDGQWTRAKSFDTFCPVGPWIETDLDPSDTLITCRVNSELRQMASTREMVFTVPQIVAYISTVMTLLPGDLIFTGTPAGVGPLVGGDEVEIEIEGIGLLRNSVRNS